jgi:arabinogalactan oligomer/maltooligosaccharide transport system substrate-binding protein
MQPKKLLFTVPLLLTAIGLSACGTPTPAPATEAPATEASAATEAPATEASAATEAPATEVPAATEVPSGETKTITVWHQWEGKYVESIEAIFAEYESAHPGITIDLSKPEDTNNALNVAIPAGEGPDIIGWANDQIGTHALTGNIVPLGEYGITQEFLSQTYEPAAIQGVVWQEQIWGLPETQEGVALIYNKDLIKEEELPTDLAGLLALAQSYAAANPDKYLVCNQAFNSPSDAYHAAPVYFGFGVPQYVDDTGKVYINSPEAIAAGEWLTELAKVSAKEQTYDICNAGLAEGKFAMWWTGPWAIAGIADSGVNYGILPMGKPFVGIKTLMLSQNAVERGNAEIALDIMKYYTSAEVQAKLAVLNGTIPAQTAALADPEVAELGTVTGFGASLNAGVPMSNSPFASAQWQAVADSTAAIWSSSQTPDVALKAAQDAMEKAIADMQ